MSDSSVLDSTSEVSWHPMMAWLTCLSAGLFFFYEFFQLTVFDVINPFLRHDFKIDAAQLSWMSSTFVWANVLFLLPAGLILDHCSIRRVILWALLICIVGTLGFGLATSFIVAAFCHGMTGIGNAFCFLSCVVLVSRWFPPQRQALVIGCIVTMACIGGMMAHVPFAYLIVKWGWRHAILFDAVIGGAIFVWIFIIVTEKPVVLRQDVQAIAWWVSFKRALCNLQNWLAGIYTACLNLPVMVLCALWGASYLQEVHQLKAINASSIVSFIFIGSIVGCPLMGWLSDTAGRRKPFMMFGTIATFIAIMPLCMGIQLSEIMLGILFFAVGLFSSAQVISYPLIAESNSKSNTGVATGIASFLIMGGGGAGQVLFGYLMQHHAVFVREHYSVSDFQFAMWIFPAALSVAFVTNIIIRETYCKRRIDG